MILPHWDSICQEAMSDINQSIDVNKFISVRVLLFDPAPVRVGEIGGPRFSFHKGQDFDPAEY